MKRIGNVLVQRLSKYKKCSTPSSKSDLPVLIKMLTAPASDHIMRSTTAHYSLKLIFNKKENNNNITYFSKTLIVLYVNILSILRNSWPNPLKNVSNRHDSQTFKSKSSVDLKGNPKRTTVQIAVCSPNRTRAEINNAVPLRYLPGTGCQSDSCVPNSYLS